MRMEFVIIALIISVEMKSKTSRELEELLDNIKKRKNLKYDCIVGLSGGVDSTFSLIKVQENGP